MKKWLLFVFVSFLLVLCAQAQDTIVKTNGEQLSVKVLEVGDVSIRYQSVSRLNGPVMSISRTEVASIRYANGLKEVITKQKALAADSAATVVIPGVAPGGDQIIFRKGKYYRHGMQIRVKELIRVIETSGNAKAVMQLKMYKRYIRGSQTKLAVGISMMSTGIPILVVSTAIRAGVPLSTGGKRFITGTQVVSGVIAAGGVGFIIGSSTSRKEAAVILQQAIATYNSGIGEPH